MDSNTLESLQRIALKNVLEPDFDAFMRGIRRWYCITFNTALHDVEDLEDEYILLHYFEHTFEELPPEERKDKIGDVLKTAKEKAEERDAEAKFDKDLMDEMEEEAKALKAKKVPKKEAIKEMPQVQAEPPIKVSFVDQSAFDELINSAEKGNL